MCRWRRYMHPRLRIMPLERPTFTGLASSPRVRLRSTTRTQSLPSYQPTTLPSQNASVHVLRHRRFVVPRTMDNPRLEKAAASLVISFLTYRYVEFGAER